MGKFENDIENRLGNFALTPSEHVWEGVEASLHEKKKRRMAIWWWVPVAGVLLLGAGWWLLDNGNRNAQQPKEMVSITVENKKADLTAKNEDEKQPSITAKTFDETTNKEIDANRKLSIKNIAKKYPVLALHGMATGGKSYQQKKVVIKQAIQTAIPVANVADKSSTDKKNAVIDIDGGQTNIASTKQQEVAQEEITVANKVQADVDSLTKLDSTIAIAKQTILVKKDSTMSAVLVDTSKKKIRKQQHQWLVTVGGGISLVKGNNLLSTSSSSYDYASAFNSSGGFGIGSSPGSGQSNMNRPRLPLPKTGFFFLAGAAYETSMSKHWNVNIGLQYRYIQNKQAVYDSLTGNSGTGYVTNTSHWLDLPVSLKYFINPNSPTKFGLQVGGSVAWAFSQQWAVIPSTNNYYYDKALNNNIILGLNAGAFIKTATGLTLTFMGEQCLTPIHKTSNNKYYWRQWSAQVSLPLNLLYKPKN